jgi:hypothetical protein
MKKTILTVAAIFAVGALFAQNIDDALRYSSSNTTGTARFSALGGAFGALGGDLSALNTNPASGAVFTRNTTSFTLSSENLKNEVNYFNGNNNSTDTDVSFNQIGGVFIFETSPDSNWKKFSLGFNYDRTQNFDDRFVASGTGNTSIASYFLSFADGVPLDLIELRDGESISDLYQFLGENEGFGSQQAFLGFQSFLIDPVSFNAGNTSYVSNVAGNSFDQDYTFISDGYNGKAAFNLATQYKDNLYLGINLNSHFFDYQQTTILRERNASQSSLVNAVRFENNLRTFGSGFSFQLGAIQKVGDDIRLGFTYDSPTWITISEEGSQRIVTDRVEDENVITADVNPRITNVFQDYQLTTPAKYTGSIAYLFGTQGLLSLDYVYTDYSQISFRPKSDPFFDEQNTNIDTRLRAAGTYRLGGEYRMAQWSFRGGYNLTESPYEDEETIGDLTGYSLGLGYNFGEIKLDFAYQNQEQDRNQSLYTTGLTSQAGVTRNTQNFIATLTFSL